MAKSARRWISVGALLAASTFIAGAPVQAAQVVGVFQAYVTSVPNPGSWNGAGFGDWITGSFAYDTAYLPPNDPFCAGNGTGCYFATNPAHSFMSISFTLDSVTYDFADDQSTTLSIGDYIQTKPGYKFDQFTAGASGAVTEIGGGAPGAHTGSAFVQVYPYVQIFTSGDPLQTFSVGGTDLHGVSGNTATLDGLSLGFSTISMSDSIVGAAAIPEPATWMLMILGWGAVGARLRRRALTRTA